MIVSLFASLLAAPVPAAAPSPMAPLDFLVGHCWLGKPKANQTDKHCFRRLPDGSVRDHNEVTVDGKPKGSGDTLYRWNAARRFIQYTYRDSLGGVLSSTVKRSGNTIELGTAAYRTKDGKSYTVTARWTILNATAYQSELSSPSFPMMKRIVKYERVG